MLSDRKSYQSISVFTTVEKMDVSCLRSEGAILRMCSRWHAEKHWLAVSQVSALLNGCDSLFGTIDRTLVLRLMYIGCF